MTPALRSARKAIQEGNVSAARRQLLQILQDDKDNYRAWLWLSGITSQPDASHEYALRAQAIAPENEMVQNAVVWAQERKQQRRIVEVDPDSDEVEVVRIDRPSRPDIGLPVRDKPHVVQPSIEDELLDDDEAPSDGVWRWLGIVLVLLAVVAILTYIIIQGGTFSRAFDPYSEVLASSAVIEPGKTGALLQRQNGGVNQARVAPDSWVSAESQSNLPPIVVVWEVTPTPVAAVESDDADVEDSAEIIAQIPGLIPKVALKLEEPIPRWTPTPAPTATPTPEPAATALPVLASSQNVQFNEWRWIDVNLTTQYLTAYENGQEVFSTYISSGLPETPTVVGQFRIYLRLNSQHMTGYHMGYDYSIPNVPHVQYFHGNFGLHGAYWHENFGNPMSHGCVNLDEADAAWLYNFADIGTLVNVHY